MDSVQAMITSFLKVSTRWLALAAASIFIASCKPKEPAANPPATNSTPAVASAVTNVPEIKVEKPVINITPQEAKNHIGETAIVKGKVFDVHVTQKGDVFLNFGGKYPNSVFTAGCFQGAIPAEELKALNGKLISVKGEIKEYNGQVEIVLESVEQIMK